MSINQELDWLLKEKYHNTKTPEFEADCIRLAAGEPLAYLIGSIPFLDCTIYLDSHPLIPRTETEFWVEQAIKAILSSLQTETLPEVKPRELPRFHLGKGFHILDLCAGSGAIGVAVAKAVSEASVTFGEIDPSHLLTIKKNLQENVAEYPNRLGYYPVIESDLFADIDPSVRFDFILTNPPYIDNEAGTVDMSVVAHEPHLALFGGAAGMEIIEKIIIESGARLNPAGQLWIEHEPFQSLTIKDLATKHGFTCVTHRDQYDTERYSILTRATL